MPCSVSIAFLVPLAVVLLQLHTLAVEKLKVNSCTWIMLPFDVSLSDVPGQRTYAHTHTLVHRPFCHLKANEHSRPPTATAETVRLFMGLDRLVAWNPLGTFF